MKRKGPDKTTRSNDDSGLTKMLWPIGGFLVGTLLTWSFVVPLDATSVFEGSAQPQNLFWLLASGFVAAAVVGSKRGHEGGRLSWCAVLFGLVTMIAVSLQAGQNCNGRTAWYGFWHVVSLAGAYYCARILLAGPRARSAALLIILTGCFALAVHGLYQVAVEFPANRAQFEEDPEFMIRNAGFDAPEGSAMRRSFRDRLYSPEPFATFALANSLAVLLSGGLVLAVALSVTAVRDYMQTKTAYALASAILAPSACVLLLVTWFLTRSRTGYLAVMMVFLFWGLHWWITKRRLKTSVNWKPILIAGSLAALVFAGGLVWLVRNDRLVLSEAAKSLLFRMEYWQATVDLMCDHWCGVGFGNFQAYYPRYMLPTASETIADPHNWFLDIAASLSLPIAMLAAVWLAKQFTQPTNAAEELASAPEDIDAAIGDASVSKSLLVGAIAGGILCLFAVWLLLGLDIGGVVLAWAIAVPIGLILRESVTVLASKQPLAIRLAAGAMLLCLFASGSWQASGIALPFILLLVCSTPPLSISLSQEIGETSEPKRSAIGRWSALGLAILGFGIFVNQSWMPTTRCWSLLQQATLAMRFDTRLELSRAAVDADPLDSVPLRWIAQTLSWNAEENSTSAEFDRTTTTAIEALNAWLDSDSVPAGNWQFAGDRLLKLAARARDLELDATPLLSQAQRYYSEALLRRPPSVLLHLQLAAVYALMDDKTAAFAELQLAESLSEQTPHADKKLSAQQIWLPLKPLEMPPGADSSAVGEYVPGEPVAQWIRSL